MRSLLLGTLALALASPLASADEIRVDNLAARPREPVVLFIVAGEGITTPVAAIADVARRAIESNMHARVVSPEEAFVQAGIDLQSQLAACRGDDTCYGKLVNRSSVDAQYLMVLSASMVGEDRVLGARFVDLYAMRALGNAIDTVSHESSLLSEVGKRIEECVPGELWNPYGGLTIESTTSGAEIVINGTIVGVTPLGKLGGLLPGEYTVVLRKVGFRPFEAKVTVERQGSATLAADLTEEEAPTRWWLWALIGGVVVAGAATGLAVGLSSGGPAVFCSAPDLSLCQSAVNK